MTYECLVHGTDGFVVARRSGWAWSCRERMEPFTIASAEIPSGTSADDDITLSDGSVVKAGDIDRSLYLIGVVNG